MPTINEELRELDQRWAKAEIEADAGQHLSLIGGPPPFAGRTE